jgi:hypothetical protein
MKITVLAVSLAMSLPGWAETPPRQAHGDTVPQERISDRYARQRVKSYELFKSDIAGHCLMFVQLNRGESFPMLCRKSADGVKPIPQSVFAGPGIGHWEIMCEPQGQSLRADAPGRFKDR